MTDLADPVAETIESLLMQVKALTQTNHSLRIALHQMADGRVNDKYGKIEDPAPTMPPPDVMHTIVNAKGRAKGWVVLPEKVDQQRILADGSDPDNGPHTIFIYDLRKK